jgi:hypothetical protein
MEEKMAVEKTTEIRTKRKKENKSSQQNVSKKKKIKAKKNFFLQLMKICCDNIRK